MSFPVTFYAFAKYPNSTRIPTANTFQKQIDCEFNDSCSFSNPVINVGVTAFPPVEREFYKYNYCYIPTFSRYYFIDEWIWNAGMWSCKCHVDVLASFRDPILNGNFYVMRSTYTSTGAMIYNTDIADATYPTTAGAATYQSSAVNNPFAVDDDFSLNGTFVVGVINSQSQNGAISYYAMSVGTFLEFCQKLYTYSSGWLNINTDEISESLQKALVNPFQYVVSCIYLPVNISALDQFAFTSTRTIYFGWWSVTIYTDAKIVNSAMHIDFTHQLQIPRHPLAASRGRYLNLSPYSLYTLRYYPFGTINIDTEAIAGWTTLDLYTSLDVVTGKGVLNLAVNGKNNPLRTIEAQVGVSVPTASLQTSFQQIAQGKTAVVAAGAELVGKLNHIGESKPNPADYDFSISGGAKFALDSVKGLVNDVRESFSGGDIKQTATEILSTAVAASTTAEIQGLQGSGSLYRTQTLTLSGRFLPIAEEDFYHTGRPLMQNRLLKTLSGFCIVKDGDINISALDKERQAIRAFLEGGFYIE